MSQPLPQAMQQVVERLLAFIGQDTCTEAQFNAMALDLFAFQFEHNAPLRNFCQRRGLTPRRVQHWQDIPAVPISAFKDATLTCLDAEHCERVFMTSGTSRGEIKGRNYHPTIAVWDLSMRSNFARRFVQKLSRDYGSGAKRMPMLLLFPDESQTQNSSLARYLTQAAQSFGETQGALRNQCFVSAQGLDIESLRRVLDIAIAQAKPVALLGASYSFVHLMDAFQAEGKSYRLPLGSMILDTGGYKNQARDLALDAFYEGLSKAFGVRREHCINMYGMTELSSQFYDKGNATLPSVKSGPHWLRTRVLDPLTGLDMPSGEVGLLAHYDLANFNASLAILTEDVGIAVEGGFQLLGRAQGAQAKGCSLAVQEFLELSR